MLRTPSITRRESAAPLWGCALALSLAAGCSKGSKHWHAEMPLDQHLAIIEREFHVGEPYSAVLAATQDLWVEYAQLYGDAPFGDNQAAQGKPRLLVELYPPRQMLLTSPVLFEFYTDDADQLTEVWLNTHELGHPLESDLSARGVPVGLRQAAALPPPEDGVAYAYHEDLNAFKTTYIRVPPPAGRLNRGENR